MTQGRGAVVGSEPDVTPSCCGAPMRPGGHVRATVTRPDDAGPARELISRQWTCETCGQARATVRYHRAAGPAPA